MKRWSNNLFYILLALLLNSCGYRPDRFDEHVLTQQSDHYNLFRHVRLEVLDDLNRPDDAGLPAKETTGKLLSGEPLNLGNGENAYATIAVLTKRTPPLVQIYQEMINQKERKLLFSVPLGGNNAILLRHEPNGIQTFQILLSLRHDTIAPILKKNNYELFILTLRHHTGSDQWELTEFKSVTDGKPDAIQGVFNPSGALIAYIEDDRKNRTQLVVMNRDGTDRRVVSDNALLPCFLPSGELIFVENSGTLREFCLYTPSNGKIRRASDAEITRVLRAIPYSGLKEFYRRFERGKQPADVPKRQEISLRKLYEYGLRNSPVILQSYYEYLAIKARNTQNLYDIGPDFFMNADYLLTSSIFFDTPDSDYYVIGDRLGNDNFIRFMTGLSIPVIPNLPLRWAQRYYDNWVDLYGKASLLKSVNEFSGRLPRFALDYWQAISELEGLNRQMAKNNNRIERFRHQLDAGVGTPERVLFARNIHAGLESDRNAALEHLLQSQTQLAALVGISPEREIVLTPQENVLDRLGSIRCDRPTEWFLAQARINRQELRQIDALIQQDAATRDMGPEQTRIDAIRVRISYGVGFLDWQQLVDDFLLMGVSYAVPLRLPIFFQSYYQDYDARIDALRMRKYQTDGAIQAEVLSAWGDWSVQNGRAAHRVKRADTLREQSRMAGLLQVFGTRDMMPPDRDADEYTLELESLGEQTLGYAVRYERLRRLSLLYQAAGRSDLFLRETLKSLETGPLARPRTGAAELRGIYLWSAPEVVMSRKERNAFLERCRANGINLVYCYFSMKKDRIPFLQKYEPEYAFFVESCHRQGMQVLALIGEPEWLDTAQRADLRTLLESYMAFNRKLEARGMRGFDGLSLDVEPHSESGWHSGLRDELIRRYLSLLDLTAGVVGKEKLNIAVPNQYSNIPVPGQPGDLMKEAAQRVGSLTLMAYRNSAEKVLNCAEPVLARRDLGCRILVAVETNHVEEPGVSFYGMSRQDFLAALAVCAERCSQYQAFSGMVIHDDSGFRKMNMNQDEVK